MNELDVINYMGRFPDAVINDMESKTPERMVAKVWACARCGAERSFTKAVTVPSLGCDRCGCIFWRVVK